MHGGALLSSVCGRVSRVNKLVSVHPSKHRYSGEIGDLVVGRVTAVDAKRWKVDIGGCRDAVLQLSSVNLPDGAQRIRTHEDALQMREVFEEGDLVSAEIQNVSGDGVAALHTRSLKYGKLHNGHMVRVPSALVRRMAQHYVSLDCGVDVLLGMNGCVWVTRTMAGAWLEDSAAEANSANMQVETLSRLQELHASTPIDADVRRRICRVRNSVLVLAGAGVCVTPESITGVYRASERAELAPSEMLVASNMAALASQVA